MGGLPRPSHRQKRTRALPISGRRGRSRAVIWFVTAAEPSATTHHVGTDAVADRSGVVWRYAVTEFVDVSVGENSRLDIVFVHGLHCDARKS